MEDENSSINDILILISEITTQSNTNVTELKGFLEQIAPKENKLSLITNSQSANLIDLLNQTQISFEMFENQTEKRINLLPLLGLSSLFKCTQCTNTHLEDSSNIAPLVLQCPRCKNPMFPSFMADKGIFGKINLEYYTESISTLANSKVWLIVNQNDDKFSLNILKTALKLSNAVEDIYIIHKDINTREMLKHTFNTINSNVRVNVSNMVIEDFLHSI